MVYLIGVSHSLQVCAIRPFRDGGLENYGSRNLALHFERYLNKMIDRLKPQIVCEEYGEEQLRVNLTVDDKAYLVAKRVCLTRGDVKHMFCDPDQSQRDALYTRHGKTEAEDARNGFPIREDEWLRRLDPLLPDTSIFFICGANHVSTFHRKLRARSLVASILCKDFESACAHEFDPRLSLDSGASPAALVRRPLGVS